MHAQKRGTHCSIHPVFLVKREPQYAPSVGALPRDAAVTRLELTQKRPAHIYALRWPTTYVPLVRPYPQISLTTTRTYDPSIYRPRDVFLSTHGHMYKCIDEAKRQALPHLPRTSSDAYTQLKKKTRKGRKKIRERPFDLRSSQHTTFLLHTPP